MSNHKKKKTLKQIERELKREEYWLDKAEELGGLIIVLLLAFCILMWLIKLG